MSNLGRMRKQELIEILERQCDIVVETNAFSKAELIKEIESNNILFAPSRGKWQVTKL